MLASAIQFSHNKQTPPPSQPAPAGIPSRQPPTHPQPRRQAQVKAPEPNNVHTPHTPTHPQLSTPTPNQEPAVLTTNAHHARKTRSMLPQPKPTPTPTTNRQASRTIRQAQSDPIRHNGLPRKEVIQPHLPVRLPCYDFVPIANPTFDSSPKKLGHWLRVLPTFMT